ncbi:hypothetical protein [Gallaecimonas pentaromativorans]|uniref:hypothetical protein n=1 Tax=Gallaecimonas pentaromativorans TaxID=584787 RepID=UPI003A8D0C65
MSFLKQNKDVDALVAVMKSRLSEARDKHALYALLTPALSFKGPVKYNNTPLWVVALVGIAIAAINAANQRNLRFNGHQELVTTLWVLATLATLIPLGWIAWRSRRLKGLSDAIWQKNLLLDNQLAPVPCDGAKEAKALGQRFYDFRRGNHRRSIDALYKGHYQGEQHSFDYRVFHFHYVDKHTHTSTDSKGRTTTRTSYSHYHRYGLLLDFGYARNIAILGNGSSGHKGSRWEPASLDFRKCFKVLTDDEMAAARFLKPAVVEALTTLGAQFRRANLEFNADGALCLSVSDNDLVSLPRPLGLEAPQAFLALLKEDTPLPKLRQLLKEVHLLLVHSDNNF